MTENVSLTFNAVVNINEGVKMDDLLFKETDWIGEPKSSNGCVIGLVLKSVSTADKTTVERVSKEEVLPLVKAVRLIDTTKWNTKPGQMIKALQAMAGYELMIQNANNSIVFSTSAHMLGKQVLVGDVTVIVGAA
jgi:hypothetical protein